MFYPPSGGSTRVDQFYSDQTISGGRAQPSSQPISGGNNTLPQPVAEASPHVAFSWVGVLIALVALRVVYEVSE
jgi:hypothetical protein